MMNSSGLRDRVRKKRVNNIVFISKVIEYQREMNDSKKRKIKSYTQYIYIYIIQKFVSREYYLLKERISSLPPRNHSTFLVKTKPRETFKWPPSSGTTRTHMNISLLSTTTTITTTTTRREGKILERNIYARWTETSRKVLQSGASATKRGGAETKKAFTNFSYQCINPRDRITPSLLSSPSFSPPTFSTPTEKGAGQREQWIPPPLSPKRVHVNTKF